MTIELVDTVVVVELTELCSETSSLNSYTLLQK